MSNKKQKGGIKMEALLFDDRVASQGTTFFSDCSDCNCSGNCSGDDCGNCDCDCTNCDCTNCDI